MGCLPCRHHGSSPEVSVFLSIFTVHSMMMTDDQIFLHLDKLVACRGCTSKPAQTAKELDWRGLPRKQARLTYRRELVCQEGVIGVSDK